MGTANPNNIPTELGEDIIDKVNQLKENIKSIEIKLSKEILEQIDDIHLSDPNPCV